MDLSELLSYKPVTSSNTKSSDPDDVFKAPELKRPRQLAEAPSPYANISATPGRTPRKIMAAGTPYVSRNAAAQLDMVENMTPQNNGFKSTPYHGVTPKVYPTEEQEQVNEEKVQEQTPLTENDRLASLLEKLEQENAALDPKAQIPVLETANEAKRLLINLKKMEAQSADESKKS